MGQWFYTKNGVQAGPVDESQLKQLLASGQIGAADLVWKEGMANWVPASAVPELGVAGPFPGQPAGGQPYPPQQGPQPLPYGGYGAVQQQTGQQQGGPPVPNYLVQAILVTIFCCWPLGIPAIVFAAQVNAKLARGDYAGAVESSNKAKMFSWIAFGLGLLVVVIYFIIGIVGAMSHH